MVGILVGEFEGLGTKDFDVYAESCWSSNLHNLDRMRTKERVLELARRMREAASDLPLALEASSEIPSVWNHRQVKDQWAYLLRDEAERKKLEPVVAADLDLAAQVQAASEIHRHLLLCVRLDHDGLEVGLRAHRYAGVDLANLINRAEAEPTALEGLLADLPDGVRLDGRRPTVTDLVAAARATRAGEPEWFVLGRRLERREAIELGAGLARVVREVAEAVLPLYRFGAWSEANDHVGVRRRLDEMAAERAREAEARAAAEAEAQRQREERRREAQARAAALQAERDAWRKLRAQQRARAPIIEEMGPPPRRRGSEGEPTPRAEQAERPPRTGKPERPPRAEQAERPPRTGKPERPPRAEKPERQRPQRAAKAGGPKRGGDQAPAAALDLAIGDACVLTRGLLAGKEGVVTGKEAGGQLKVRVGNLEVRVAAADLRKPD